MKNSQYFYRSAVFTRKDNQVALADIHHPQNTSPLDDWMGMVVSLADGKHTIEELVGYLKKHYPMPPENLEKTLHSVLERLVDGEIVRLTDEKVELPYYLASPVEELDLEKAKKLMNEDGYQVH